MALILLDKQYSMSWMEEEMAVAKFKMLRAKKEWFSYAEYLSVMPARKMKGYSNFMGDKI